MIEFVILTASLMVYLLSFIYRGFCFISLFILVALSFIFEANLAVVLPCILFLYILRLKKSGIKLDI